MSVTLLLFLCHSAYTATDDILLSYRQQPPAHSLPPLRDGIVPPDPCIFIKETEKCSSDPQTSRFFFHVKIFHPDTYTTIFRRIAFRHHAVSKDSVIFFKNISLNIRAISHTVFYILSQNLVRRCMDHRRRIIKYPTSSQPLLPYLSAASPESSYYPPYLFRYIFFFILLSRINLHFLPGLLPWTDILLHPLQYTPRSLHGQNP